MESAHARLGQAGIPEHYWAEAVATATYLWNWTPTRALKEKKMPYEKWYGRKADLSHFRVFSCMAYAYIPDAKRKGKLSKKVKKTTFHWIQSSNEGVSSDWREHIEDHFMSGCNL